MKTFRIYLQGNTWYVQFSDLSGEAIPSAYTAGCDATMVINAIQKLNPKLNPGYAGEIEATK